MRRKRERILSFVSGSSELPKTVREYRENYIRIGEKLDEHAEILDRSHRVLSKLYEGGKRGRAGDFTSEALLRLLIIMMVEGLSQRETTVRIAEREFLQDFVRTRKKAVMDLTFLTPFPWTTLKSHRDKGLAMIAVSSVAVFSACLLKHKT